jgi:hypothetical protein
LNRLLKSAAATLFQQVSLAAGVAFDAAGLKPLRT